MITPARPVALAALAAAATPTAPAARPVRGLTGGAAAALLGAVVFGFVQGKTGQRGHEMGYWALCTGLLIGVALGKLGGRTPPLALVGIPLALVSVSLAQLLGSAMRVGDAAAWATADVLTGHFGLALDYWRDDVLGRNDITFYAVAGAESYLVARRVSE
jgi:hypothetical protein